MRGCPGRCCGAVRKTNGCRDGRGARARGYPQGVPASSRSPDSRRKGRWPRWMGRDLNAAIPREIGSNGFAGLRCRWRAFRRRGGGPLLSFLELLFLLALLFQLLLPLLVPEIGFCQVVFSSSESSHTETDRSPPHNHGNAPGGGDPRMVNNTPSLVSSAMIMRFAGCLVPFAAAVLVACGGAPVKEPSADPAPAARPAPAPTPAPGTPVPAPKK